MNQEYKPSKYLEHQVMPKMLQQEKEIQRLNRVIKRLIDVLKKVRPFDKVDES